MEAPSKGIDFTVYTGSSSGRVVQRITHRDGLVGDEVLVRITHSSLCGTDEHFLKRDMCLGHEGAGVVERLGPNIKSLQVGDNVAFGYQRSYCDTCSKCLKSLEIYCSGRSFYGFSGFDIGSMASQIIFHEPFVYKVPKGMPNSEASALMCSGATVFNIFDTFHVKPTDRVGVVGIGGLGYLAIQFAAKWGCQVVAFSASESKRQDAMDYGATEFYITKNLEKFEGVSSIDNLLICTSQQISWALYLSVMASPGTVYPLTFLDEEIRIPSRILLAKGIRIQGSIVAPRVVYRRMLDFAAFHGVRATMVQYPLNIDGVERAMAEF